MWNGTAASLKASPAAMNTSPISAPMPIVSCPSGPGFSRSVRCSKDNVPVKP